MSAAKREPGARILVGTIPTQAGHTVAVYALPHERSSVAIYVSVPGHLPQPLTFALTPIELEALLTLLDKAGGIH